MFWPEKAPTLSEGIFAATWTVFHAIATLPGGVAEPMQLLVLDENGITEFAENQLDEHREMAKAAEGYLSEFPNFLKGDGEKTEPSIPPEPDLGLA